METSRALTSRRRDLAEQLIDGDSRKADAFFELWTLCDPSTPTGAAGYEDIKRYSYSRTTDSIEACQKFVKKLSNGLSRSAASVVCLVAVALNIVS